MLSECPFSELACTGLTLKCGLMCYRLLSDFADDINRVMEILRVPDAVLGSETGWNEEGTAPYQ